MRVLLIKMSSLGDVVHALPAVTDAAARGIEFDWVVEEAFASIPAGHPGVRRVLPIGWRRWRRGLMREAPALKAFARMLRAESYDMVLDAQGLIKSAAVSALARGAVRSGFNFTSAREPLSALASSRRLTVPFGGHAVDRLRTLFALAFAYPLPEGPADFGLTPAAAEASRECMLLHGTTWSSKHWPVPMWRALAEQLASSGWQVRLPWGSAAERARAEQISRHIAAAEVLGGVTLAELGRQIGQAGLVVGVDSGLTHLAAAMGRPTVVIYGSTSAVRTGAMGRYVRNLQSELHCAPCLSRECRYRGEPLRWRDEVVEPACYARLTPDIVLGEARSLLETQKLQPEQRK